MFLLYHTVVQAKPLQLMIFLGNTIIAIHLLCKQLPLFSVTIVLLEGAIILGPELKHCSLVYDILHFRWSFELAFLQRMTQPQ